jgi:predicted Zn-dependent protease
VRGNSGLMGVLAGSSQVLVYQSFSQEYELEADDAGWQLLVAARIDPRGLADMLKKLEAEDARLKLTYYVIECSARRLWPGRPSKWPAETVQD